MNHDANHSRLTDADRLALKGISGRHAIREISAEVCAQTGLSEADLFSMSRRKDICRARDVVWLVAQREGWSLTDIARTFGRDHTSVLAGINRELDRRK